MKILRFLLKCLATAAAIAAMVAAVALTPPFQTWYARMELDGHASLRASLGSLWARFGKVEVEDLKLEFGDAVLTVPSAEARLPIMGAILHRQVLVRGLVAKGWTLDLSRIPAAAAERAADALEEQNAAGAGAPAQPAAAAAQAAASAFGGILSAWRLPADTSLDGVDLEGDVLVALFQGKAPVRVHVTIGGGGVAAGREGALEVDAETVDPETGPLADSGSLRGRMLVAMETPRTVGRVGINADVSARSGPLREELTVKAAAGADRAAGAEHYTLELARGGRRVAAIQGDIHMATQRLEGTWKVDFLDSDLAPFMRGRPLPPFVATGAGSFDSDSSVAEVHARGQLSAVASQLGVLVPSMGGPGKASFVTKFDVVRSGQTLRFSQLLGSYFGDGQVLNLRVLQPFDLDEGTGGVKPRDAGSDWLSINFGGLPLAWLGPLPGGLAFTGGKAAGGYLVRASGGGFAARQMVAPLTVSGVSVSGPAGVVASGLDLSLSMTAEYDAKQLEVDVAPLAIESAGRRLASLEAKCTRQDGEHQPIAVSGKWSANNAVIASQPNLAALGWLPGRSATGDFTGNLGASCDIEGKVDLAGRDPARAVSATFNVDSDGSGAVDFLVPIKMTLGESVAEISAEGSWGRQKSNPRLELKLTSADASLDQLLLLAGPIAAAAGASPGATDRIPFWGGWAGSLKVSFDRLRTGDQDFTNVGGSFEFDRGSVQLEGGHGEVPPKSMASVEGSITFDPGSQVPYSLKGTLAPVANLDSALLLPAQPGQDPVIEGHFTLAGTVTGSGASLGGLISSAQEEFQLSSSSGIIRLLTTNVADAIPEAAEPVADSLDTVGNFVGSVLLGIKGHSIDPSKNKLSKAAEAVLSFTNQVSEIEYDKVTVTAVRGPDRTIRLVALEMTAPDEHLRGTGQIAYAKGLPVSQEPLSVELRLGVKDMAAKLLSKVGLLSPDKDELGYPLLNQPIQFGGSLVRIDDKAWHDLLAKAATQKPAEAGKKEKAGP